MCVFRVCVGDAVEARILLVCLCGEIGEFANNIDHASYTIPIILPIILFLSLILVLNNPVRISNIMEFNNCKYIYIYIYIYIALRGLVRRARPADGAVVSGHMFTPGTLSVCYE